MPVGGLGCWLQGKGNALVLATQESRPNWHAGSQLDAPAAPSCPPRGLGAARGPGAYRQAGRGGPQGWSKGGTCPQGAPPLRPSRPALAPNPHCCTIAQPLDLLTPHPPPSPHHTTHSLSPYHRSCSCRGQLMGSICSAARLPECAGRDGAAAAASAGEPGALQGACACVWWGWGKGGRGGACRWASVTLLQQTRLLVSRGAAGGAGGRGKCAGACAAAVAAPADGGQAGEEVACIQPAPTPHPAHTHSRTCTLHQCMSASLNTTDANRPKWPPTNSYLEWSISAAENQPHSPPTCH